MQEFVNDYEEIYTPMSYLYFDNSDEKDIYHKLFRYDYEEKENSIYRRLFEHYISADNPEEIISKESFQQFEELCKKISNIPDEEYLKIFKGVINNATNIEETMLEKLILTRKQTLIEESRNFIERLNKLREINKSQDVYENGDSIAFINDIHGNREALKTLLDECVLQGKNNVYILGDMISIGPESNECIELIRDYSAKLNIRCVLGNHELYALMGNNASSNATGFNEDMTTRTRKSLSIENRRYIESLPLVRRIKVGDKNIQLCHFPIKRGEIDDWDIYQGHRTKEFNAEREEEDKCIIYGHEHRTEEIHGNRIGSIGVQESDGVKYINLPSSGCVSGEYTSYVTMDDGKFEVNAVKYNQENTLKKIDEKKTGHEGFFRR